MNAAREQDRVKLTFNALESRVIRHILNSIIATYKVSPAQIDPKAAAAWYSTRGCQTAKMTAEETRDWLDQLHSFKSANLALLEEWVHQVGTRQDGQYELQLKVEQASRFLTVLNDHRLLAAAQNDIGQAEMDLPTRTALNKLTPAQQMALFEIHLLAWIIEEVLRLVAPEATDWMS